MTLARHSVIFQRVLVDCVFSTIKRKLTSGDGGAQLSSTRQLRQENFLKLAASRSLEVKLLFLAENSWSARYGRE